MCQSKEEGGRRCPSSNGEYRRAYQRARYAAKKTEAIHTEGFSAPPRPREAVGKITNDLATLSHHELAERRRRLRDDIDHAQHHAHELIDALYLNQPGTSWDTARYAILAAAPRTIAGVHIAHAHDHAAITELERLHVNHMRTLGGHVHQLAQLHAAEELKRRAAGREFAAETRIWKTVNLPPLMHAWHRARMDVTSPLHDPDNTSDTDLVDHMCLIDPTITTPQKARDAVALLSTSYDDLQRRVHAQAKEETRTDAQLHRHAQQAGLLKAMADVCDYTTHVDATFINGAPGPTETVRDAMELLPSPARAFIADRHDHIDVVASTDGSGFYAARARIKGKDTAVICASDADTSLAVHELCHALEHHPHIHAATKRYLDDRTANCAETTMIGPAGDPIQIKADGFAGAYAGRDYPGTVHTEILTTAIQSTLGDGYLLSNEEGWCLDPDQRDFAIGLLAAFPHN